MTKPKFNSLKFVRILFIIFLSGPHLPSVNGIHGEDDDDCWSESSTLSNEDVANYSAAASIVANVSIVGNASSKSANSSSAIVKSPSKQVVSVIKPKERKGQILQALTLPTPMKNALDDIGHTAKEIEKKSLAPKNPFEEDDTLGEDELADFNDRTLKNVPRSRDQDDTLRRSPHPGDSFSLFSCDYSIG